MLSANGDSMGRKLRRRPARGEGDGGPRRPLVGGARRLEGIGASRDESLDSSEGASTSGAAGGETNASNAPVVDIRISI
jgi:hypothetical protein